MRIRDRLSALPPFEKWIDHIPHNRSRPYDRHLHHDVIKLLRHQARQARHLRPALDLEHPHRVGPLQRGIYDGIVRWKMRQIHFFVLGMIVVMIMLVMSMD